MKVKPDDRAPDFSLPGNGGKPIALKDFRGQKLVLYFYPKDDTPGCTLEAKDFTALAPQFKKAKTAVVGVSKDSPERHDKFCQKYGLKVRLASDAGGEVLDAYGVWKEKSLYGRTFLGIQRSTVLIDAKGIVRAVWPKVSVKGHAAEVLEKAKKL
ncbi:MAG TPA: peroxiredoxin [Sphingomonadales bacterium]|nr:peroxiredoxin [Sphingomonadales bacterium]